MICPPILLVAAMFVVPTAGALAQNNTNNPGNIAGATGSQIDTPHYPPGTGSDPALTTGTLPKGATGVPADKNPNVSGATGHTIVPGTHSTVAGDRKETIMKKTGP